MICNEQLHPIHCDFGPELFKVGSYKIASVSVCLSVSQSVTHFSHKLDAGEAGTAYGFVPVSLSVITLSENWLICFFLIFCMKLGYHKGTKLTEPDFSGKFLFWVFGAKRVQKGPKIGSLSFFSRLLHYFFLILDPNLKSSLGNDPCQSVSSSVC